MAFYSDIFYSVHGETWVVGRFVGGCRGGRKENREEKVLWKNPHV